MHLTHDIAGFGRRFFAFLVDAILLILVSFIIFFCIDDYFYQHPAVFTVLGFVLVLIYFGIMDSHITDGKTFGKSMLGVRVVHTDNQHLSLFASFVRSFIFLVPICLSSFYYWIDDFDTKIWLIAFFSALASSMCYLFIFNRHSKQSVHDLAVRSIVIDINKAEAYEKEIWKYHYLFLILFVGFITYNRISPLIEQNRDPVLAPLIKNTDEPNPEIVHIRAKTLSMDHGQHNVSMNIYVDHPELVEDPNYEKHLVQSLNPKDFEKINHLQLKINSIGQFGFYVSLHQKIYDITKNNLPH